MSRRQFVRDLLAMLATMPLLALGIKQCADEERAQQEQAEKEKTVVDDNFVTQNNLRFEKWKSALTPGALMDYVKKINVPVKGYADLAQQYPGFKTAAQMMLELPDGNPAEGKYSEAERQFLSRYMIAESEQESGHQYSALGTPMPEKHKLFPSEQALSRYQVMPTNWIQWSQELFGKGVVVTPNPQAVEYMAFRKFLPQYPQLRQEYTKKGIAPTGQLFQREASYRMANWWYSGRAKEIYTKDIDLKFFGIQLYKGKIDFASSDNLDINDYAVHVQERMKINPHTYNLVRAEGYRAWLKIQEAKNETINFFFGK